MPNPKDEYETVVIPAEAACGPEDDEDGDDMKGHHANRIHT